LPDFEPFVEDRGALGNGRSGGDDVINEEDSCAAGRGRGELFTRLEDVGQIRKSLAAVELGLTGGLFDPLEEGLVGEVHPLGSPTDEFEGEFTGLIEAPLAQSSGVQRHRYDPPGAPVEPLIPPYVIEHDAEETTKMALFPIFEMMHQSLSRPAPAVDTDGEVDREFTIAAIPTPKRGGARRLEPLSADATVMRPDGDERALAGFAKKGFHELPRRLKR
jgi:hypothetical protein